MRGATLVAQRLRGAAFSLEVSAPQTRSRSAARSQQSAQQSALVVGFLQSVLAIGPSSQLLRPILTGGVCGRLSQAAVAGGLRSRHRALRHRPRRARGLTWRKCTVVVARI